MGSQASTIICPNCGAEMKSIGFASICNYCGYINTSQYSNENLGNSTSFTRIRFSYLVHNEKYLEKNKKFVSFVPKYKLKTSVFFHPHKGYEAISSVSISIAYINNNCIEELRFYLKVDSPSQNPFLIFKLKGGECIFLHFIDNSDMGYYSNISYQELKAICMSSSILYSTNCFPLDYDFSELPIYCARFYNIAFDRNKYVYSLNKQLISD